MRLETAERTAFAPLTVYVTLGMSRMEGLVQKVRCQYFIFNLCQGTKRLVHSYMFVLFVCFAICLFAVFFLQSCLI